ncbi:ATP-dependent DNA helicase, putative [Plasmodium sp. gorilla clade G2]|uniref:ATP-dependent DNA helicase, putative n=1 Tax=Plasmodium sp. gorilla clade G2 TaxID=880535 RepID=UPI000D221034|nr:ATP-dependent DNA helicase, putative [Plasmodium sp. gorilla clade G2]SOV19081.1 ATP-dependent DNA helicase, putative [Plasmodium sp. gorilla clade G2]
MLKFLNVKSPVLSSDVDDKTDDSDKGDVSYTLEELRMKMEITQKKHFGYKNLKDFQVEAVHATFHRKDSFIVMATGMGKSLCYQIPSLMDVCKKKFTVVISPLISLMKDQVDNLNRKNISSVFLGSGQKMNNNKILNEIKHGIYKIVYCSPEYALNNKNLFILLKNRILLIAIDEVHCMSEWGHDFRPSYRKLNELRIILKEIPIMCLTATCTKNVQSDILKNLNFDLKNCLIKRSSVNKKNLFYSVREKTDIYEDLKDILDIPLRESKERTKKFIDNSKICSYNSTLIYVNSKKECEHIYSFLKEKGLLVLMYHADLTNDQKKQAHEKFLKDEIQIIVATVAFGMGIDKPDIRRIIHYGFARSLEAYVQQVGRAGRDNSDAEAILFFHINDESKIKNIILRENTANNLIETNFQRVEHIVHIFTQASDYAYSTACRRKKIYEYFDEDPLTAYDIDIFNDKRNEGICYYIKKYDLYLCAKCDNCIYCLNLIKKKYGIKTNKINNDHNIKYDNNYNNNYDNNYDNNCTYISKNHLNDNDIKKETSLKSLTCYYISSSSNSSLSSYIFDNVVDLTNELKTLLNCISSLKGKTGLSTICKILVKSKESAIIKKNYHNIKEYGKGAHRSTNWWSSFMKVVRNDRFIKETLNSGKEMCYISVGITDKGEEFLHSKEKYVIALPFFLNTSPKSSNNRNKKNKKDTYNNKETKYSNFTYVYKNNDYNNNNNNNDDIYNLDDYKYDDNHTSNKIKHNNNNNNNSNSNIHINHNHKDDVEYDKCFNVNKNTNKNSNYITIESGDENGNTNSMINKKKNIYNNNENINTNTNNNYETTHKNNINKYGYIESNQKQKSNNKNNNNKYEYFNIDKNDFPMKENGYTNEEKKLSDEQINDSIMKILLRTRMLEARKQNIPPFQLISDQPLKDICHKRLTSVELIRKHVYNISPICPNSFLEKIVSGIRGFCLLHDLKTDMINLNIYNPNHNNSPLPISAKTSTLKNFENIISSYHYDQNKNGLYESKSNEPYNYEHHTGMERKCKHFVSQEEEYNHEGISRMGQNNTNMYENKKNMNDHTYDLHNNNKIYEHNNITSQHGYIQKNTFIEYKNNITDQNTLSMSDINNEKNLTYNNYIYNKNDSIITNYNTSTENNFSIQNEFYRKNTNVLDDNKFGDDTYKYNNNNNINNINNIHSNNHSNNNSSDVLLINVINNNSPKKKHDDLFGKFCYKHDESETGVLQNVTHMNKHINKIHNENKNDNITFLENNNSQHINNMTHTVNDVKNNLSDLYDDDDFKFINKIQTLGLHEKNHEEENTKRKINIIQQEETYNKRHQHITYTNQQGINNVYNNMNLKENDIPKHDHTNLNMNESNTQKNDFYEEKKKKLNFIESFSYNNNEEDKKRVNNIDILDQFVYREVKKRKT